MALIKLTPLLQCALIKIVTTKNNSNTYSKDVHSEYLTVKSFNKLHGTECMNN